MIEITFEDTKAGLKALVDEQGSDYVYPKRSYGFSSGEVCRYVHEGKPDCIVGQFLAARGVPLEYLKEADTAYSGGGEPGDELLHSLARKEVINIDVKSISVLFEVQHLQDNGRTWGDAVRLTLELYS